MSVMVVTSLGDLVIDLFTDRCPLTSKNFLKLCKMKYYNGCLFHTVQKDFTAQTGDPTGTGSGGDSIYKFLFGDQARFFKDEIHPDLKHLKIGTVAMASAGENMNASQFYVTLRADLDYLDDKHTVFGEVAEGYDTLMRINEAYVDEKGRPFKNIRIKHTYILEDPFEDPAPLADLIPDASPEGKPKEEVDDEVRLEDDWVPMDEQLATEELEEVIRAKEAHSRAVVLESIGDIPDVDVKPPENVLFVCKLNPVTEDEDLHTIFSRFGTVTSAEVIRDYKTGDSLCYAFIEFEDQDACERAYFKMDNALIDDRRIHVDFSQSVSKLWNQFRRKGNQGKGCFKCGAPDHIAKDCSAGSAVGQQQKYVLKDDNQQRGGDKNADYEMVFEGVGSQRGKRHRHYEQGDRKQSKSERSGSDDTKRQNYGDKNPSDRDRHQYKNDEPGHDGRSGDWDVKEIKNGHSRNVRDHRDSRYGGRRDDQDHQDSQDGREYRKRYSEENKLKSGDTERPDKREEQKKRGAETDGYRSRREDRNNFKNEHRDRSRGDESRRRDERDEFRDRRRDSGTDYRRSKKEDADGRSSKDAHRGRNERLRDDK